MTVTKNIDFGASLRPCRWTASDIANAENAMSRQASSSLAMQYEVVSAKILSTCMEDNSIKVKFQAAGSHQHGRKLISFAELLAQSINDDPSGFTSTITSGNEEEIGPIASVAIIPEPSTIPSITPTLSTKPSDHPSTTPSRIPSVEPTIY